MKITNSQHYMRRIVTTSSYHYILTKAEFEELNDAITSQWEALYLEQKYDFLVENYIEFEQTILSNGLDYMIRGRSESNNVDTYTLLFNRRIMNFLTAYRSYDDGLKHHFNMIFSRDQAMTAKAKATFSAEFDSREGYFLIAILRNFVQHQGFPIHGSTYGSQRMSRNDESGQHLSRYTIDLFVTKEELSKGHFTKSEEARIDSMLKKADLKFVIRDFMEGYSAAHVKNRELLVDKLAWADQVVHNYGQKFMEASGDDSVVGLLASSTGGSPQRIHLHQIAIEQRVYLEKKNMPLVNLALRYISNELSSNKVRTEPTEGL